MRQNSNFPFWITTVAVLIALICPVLIQDGMFMDGQQYAVIAKNLADGLGTFWFPHVHDAWWKEGSPYFLEHPPLIYGIQSIFFKFLGSSMYVERIFSFFTAIVSALLITLIWRQLFKTDISIKRLSWLPVLLWIIVPVCSWSFQNDMHENTMGIFTLLSVLFSLKFIHDEKHAFTWILLSGIAIFLATLSKGIPGLFPLGVIFIYWLIDRKISFAKAFLYSVVLVVIPALIYVLLMLNDTANESLTFWFTKRLLQRVDEAHVVSNRFYILYKLFMELIPAMALSIMIIIVAKLRKIKIATDKKDLRLIIVFALIGLSASLPIMLTMVQKGFYIVPAYPYFAIALAILIAPLLKEFVLLFNNKTRYKIVLIASVVLLASAIVFTSMQIGKTSRDKDMLHDVYMIGEIVPNNTIIQIEKPLYDKYNLIYYLVRHFNISSTIKEGDCQYYLKSKSSDNLPGDGFVKMDIATKEYDLFKFKTTEQ